VADRGAALCRWNITNQTTASPVGGGKMPMVFDFAEAVPFGNSSGGWLLAIDYVCSAIEGICSLPSHSAEVVRGSAISVPLHDGSLDAIVTDPPYYDNVPYAALSDFFYIWLKIAVGAVFTEHFAGTGVPTKSEIIAEPKRHGGNKKASHDAYEGRMEAAFNECARLLKPGSPLVVVYAHKTTSGWSSLIDALRRANCEIREAWPLDTERKGREREQGSSALASSIFLVARKRGKESGSGSYDTDVLPELERIVRERVSTLWGQGISGADLVIACVGAGLRAFTRYELVEYANGEEVPAERFLAEVETVVLETILARLSKEVGGNGGRYSLAGVDPATRFYILWRYTYRWTELDAGEAIVFANGTHVELDGQGSLSQGSRALIEKKKSKYRLLDFEDRGEDEKLGLPEDGSPPPLIDALHRTLWLMENRPTQLAEFLGESQVNREQMRLVAQALAGPALKGGDLMDVSPSSELTALGKLTANWRSVVEDAALTPLERAERRTGQQILGFDER
jgi:putative DNA methylase